MTSPWPLAPLLLLCEATCAFTPALRGRAGLVSPRGRLCQKHHDKLRPDTRETCGREQALNTDADGAYIEVPALFDEVRDFIDADFLAQGAAGVPPALLAAAGSKL